MIRSHTLRVLLIILFPALFPALVHAAAYRDFGDLPRLPAPDLFSSLDIAGGGRELLYRHKTGPEFDSPGNQDAEYEFRISIPPNYDPARHYPVILWLHGAGMTYDMIPISPLTGGLIGTFDPEEVIYVMPDDREETIWLGYSDALPERPAREGLVRTYTQARVLATLRFAMFEAEVDGRTLGVNTDAVFISGISMGGSGSMLNGWMLSNLFAGVMSFVPAVGNMNEMSSTGIKILSRKMGSIEDGVRMFDNPEMKAWDFLNVARLAKDDPSARNQFFWCHWSRDDVLVPWKMIASRYPDRNFFELIQDYRVGHFFSWDEGGHLYPVQADPVLQAHWWDRGWSIVTDPVTYLRRNKSFPAFTSFAADGTTGYAKGEMGAVETAYDNTMDGDRAGCFNRLLRWRTDTIVDTPERYAIEIRIHNGEGKDHFGGSIPTTVSVTPRRLQQFHPRIGTKLTWRTDSGQSGICVVTEDGEFTCENIWVDLEWNTLTIRNEDTQPHHVLMAGYAPESLTDGPNAVRLFYALTDPDAEMLLRPAGAAAGTIVRADKQGLIAAPLALPVIGGDPMTTLLELADSPQGQSSWPYLGVGR